jgi:hypothetical protein
VRESCRLFWLSSRSSPKPRAVQEEVCKRSSNVLERSSMQSSLHPQPISVLYILTGIVFADSLVQNRPQVCRWFQNLHMIKTLQAGIGCSNAVSNDVDSTVVALNIEP